MVACICVLILSVTIVTLGKTWNVDCEVTRELCLQTQLSLHHGRSTQHLDDGGYCMDPFIDLTFHLTTTEVDPM